MDPTNKHFYATVMAPKLIQYRVSQLDEANNEYELLTLLSEIEMFARTAQSFLSEALDDHVQVDGSLSTHRNGGRKPEPELEPKSAPRKQNEDQYECPYCDFTTSNSSSLGGHMSQNHKGHKSQSTSRARKKASPTKRKAPEGFPRNLRKAREKAGLNQTELAEKVDMHPVTISKYEAGERSPKYRNLKRLADALDVPPEDLK